MTLAVLGARPAFDRPLYVGAPIVEAATRDRFLRNMGEAFDRNYLTNNGPLVQELERQIAALHGVKHCAAICNATIAQVLLLKALDLKGEIILPSFTFIATAHACLWQDLVPVFCDIDPATMMLDAAQAETLITPRTSAILGVHLFGNTCDVDALEALCRRRGLRLIFDAAHAFYCTRGRRPVGTFGDAEFLSFHATKFFGTFEGGAILTNDSTLYEAIRFLRNFGFRDYDDVYDLGLNGKMSEASAAFGLASLPEVERRVAALQRTHELYARKLAAIPGLRVLPIGTTGRSNYHYVVATIDEEAYGLERDVVYRALWKENIIARRYFHPCCHRMEFYRRSHAFGHGPLPVSEALSGRVLCLPSYLQDPERDTDAVARVFADIGRHAEEVRSAVARMLER